MSLLDKLEKNPAALPEETIHIEAWKSDVTLRGLTSRERDLFEEESMRRTNARARNGAAPGDRLEADLRNFRARLVSRHIVEGGMRTFANRRGEEILGDQPAKVLEVLFAASQRLSGFSAEDVEALTKNSEKISESEPSTDSLGSQEGQSPN